MGLGRSSARTVRLALPDGGRHHRHRSHEDSETSRVESHGAGTALVPGDGADRQESERQHSEKTSDQDERGRSTVVMMLKPYADPSSSGDAS
jgi:hypothetical protein